MVTLVNIMCGSSLGVVKAFETFWIRVRGLVVGRCVFSCDQFSEYSTWE